MSAERKLFTWHEEDFHNDDESMDVFISVSATRTEPVDKTPALLARARRESRTAKETSRNLFHYLIDSRVKGRDSFRWKVSEEDADDLKAFQWRVKLRGFPELYSEERVKTAGHKLRRHRSSLLCRNSR
jgi:hypothetical protein